MANIWNRLIGRDNSTERLEAHLKHRRILEAQRLTALSPIAGDIYTGSGLDDKIARITGAAGNAQDIRLMTYHLLRQYLPTLDAAINNRRTLEGMMVVTSDDEGLAEVINDWAKQVPVGYVGQRATARGIDNYIDLLASGFDEYGFAAGEIQLAEDGREIERLVVPSPRTLDIMDNDHDGINEIYYSDNRRPRVRVDELPTWQFGTFALSTDSIWPRPLAWSIVKSGEVLLQMHTALRNAYVRLGDPPNLFGIEFDKDAVPADSEPVQIDPNDKSKGSTKVPQALLDLKTTITALYQAKASGRMADAFAYADGGKIINEVIGDVDTSMTRYFAEHANIFDGFIVAHSRTPRWMYPNLQTRGEGIGSNLSQNEALIASKDAQDRNAIRNRFAKEVIDMWLVATGDARYVGKYDIENDSATIVDEKYMAEAAKLRAEGEAQVIENTALLFEEEGGPRFKGEALEYYEKNTDR